MERWRNERWRKKWRDRWGKADGRSPPRFLWPQYCPFHRRLSLPVTFWPFQQATGLPSALCGRPSLGLHTSCSPRSAASPSPPGTFSCFSQHFLPHPKALFLRGTSKRSPQPWPQSAGASQKKAGPSFPPEALCPAPPWILTGRVPLMDLDTGGCVLPCPRGSVRWGFHSAPRVLRVGAAARTLEPGGPALAQPCSPLPACPWWGCSNFSLPPFPRLLRGDSRSPASWGHCRA